MMNREDYEGKIKELELRLKKIESKEKDIWDKLNIIGSLLLPLAIASLTIGFSVVQMKVTKENNDNQLKRQEQLAANDREIAKINADATKRQADVAQGKTLMDVADSLLSNGTSKQKLALEVVRISLKPEDAGKLLTILSQLQGDNKSTTLQAVQKLVDQDIRDQKNQEIRGLVDQIFGPDRNLRRSATSTLADSSKRVFDMTLVPLLLDIAERDSNNYFGLVNTLFILSRVQEDAFQANLTRIRTLVNNANSILSLQDKQSFINPVQQRFK